MKTSVNDLFILPSRYQCIHTISVEKTTKVWEGIDYNARVLSFLADLSCVTHNLTTDSNNVFFGHIRINNKFHVFNTLDALQFAVGQGQVGRN